MSTEIPVPNPPLALVTEISCKPSTKMFFLLDTKGMKIITIWNDTTVNVLPIPNASKAVHDSLISLMTNSGVCEIIGQS